MTTQRTPAEEIDLWAEHARHAESMAARRLDECTTDADMVAAVRGLVADMEEIPAPLRAAEIATHDATELVRVLEENGVVFASPDNAPSQLAAAVYAGWLECFKSPHTRPVDWLSPVSHLAEAVAWAIANPEGTPERARQAVASATGTSGEGG